LSIQAQTEVVPALQPTVTIEPVKAITERIPAVPPTREPYERLYSERACSCTLRQQRMARLKSTLMVLVIVFTLLADIAFAGILGMAVKLIMG
jgi:hypothetical protein